jgi:hypothetical protein
MKVTVEHDFEGCHDGCPFFVDFGVLSPEYCEHPSFETSRKIIGYSTKSCEIPEGKDYPDWCPIANPKKYDEDADRMFDKMRTERDDLAMKGYQR